MAVLDADFCTDLTLLERGDTLWSLPIVAPASEPLDWASLLEEAEARIEEERGRARVAELRREELRRSERDARALANSLTRRLDTCRFKLKATAPKTASRAVKTLERRVESQDAEISDLRITSRRSHEHHEQVEAHHQDEINWLKQDIDRARSRIARMYRKGEHVAESLRKQFDRRLAAAQCLVEACGDLREDRRQPTVAEAIAVHRAIPTRRLAFVLCLLALGQTVMAQTQPQAEHALPLVRSASHPVQEGFVRIINRSNRRGTVSIHAIDDSGRRVGPLSLSLNAKETVHFNSEDLERGNPSKGLPPPGAGTGHGDWNWTPSSISRLSGTSEPPAVSTATAMRISSWPPATSRPRSTTMVDLPSPPRCNCMKMTATATLHCQPSHSSGEKSRNPWRGERS